MHRFRELSTAALLAFHVAFAVAQSEFGNVCVHDFLAGAACTANDVRVEGVQIVDLVEDCASGTPGEMLVSLQIRVSAAGAPDRFDVGIFMALDGGEALSGDDCLHAFLDGPLTNSPSYQDLNFNAAPELVDGPWWDGDGDACGDIESGTELFLTTPPLRILCVDGDLDGQVDLSFATSWDNNTGTTCSGVSDAFPSTSLKCRYDGQRLNIPGVFPVGTGEDPLAGTNRVLIRPGFPNPFGHSTEIAFRLADAAEISLSIHDARGRRVRTLAAQRQEAGWHQLEWDGRDDEHRILPAGIYYYQLIANGQTHSGKLTRLR